MTDAAAVHLKVPESFNFKLVRDRYRDMYQVIGDMGILTASAQIRSSGWKMFAWVYTQA